MKICLLSLYFTEQALRPVPAGVENLIPLIQGASGWLVHYVILFFKAEKAFFGDGTVRGCPIQNAPIDFEPYTVKKTLAMDPA